MFLGANTLECESSREREGQGAKKPGREKARERKGQGAKVPGSELARVLWLIRSGERIGTGAKRL